MKKIIVFLIVGLLMVTVFPVLNSYGQKTIEKEKNIKNMGFSNNYLGTITVYHIIFGNKVTFEDTNIRDFNFPVVDGKVYLNFTVNGCHLLDEMAYNFQNFTKYTTEWVCEVRDDWYTTLARGSLTLLCQNRYQPVCTVFVVMNTPVELKLNKGESKQLWVGFAARSLYNILGIFKFAGFFTAPRSPNPIFWNLIYPGIMFPITVHGV